MPRDQSDLIYICHFRTIGVYLILIFPVHKQMLPMIQYIVRLLNFRSHTATYPAYTSSKQNAQLQRETQGDCSNGSQICQSA
jgi:hypothetical protein